MKAIEMMKYLDQIMNLKRQMYQEARRMHLLAENAMEKIKEDYEEMYELRTATHFIKLEGEEVIAMAGAFIKDVCHFVITGTIPMDLSGTCMLNRNIATRVLLLH